MAAPPHVTNGVTSTERIIRIAIIGGGIGGLCLALGLLEKSHLDVQVYEAAASFSEIGAGVAFARNGAQALALIGPTARQALDEASKGEMCASQSGTYNDYKVGVGEKEGELICAQKDTFGRRNVHRAHLVDGLVKGIPEHRAHFNKRLQYLEEIEDGVTLHFQDGTTVTADAVIGADGVHSTVREFLFGADAAKLDFSGAVVYRGLAPMEKAIELVGAENALNSVVLCGPGRMVLSYPIDSGKTLNLVATEFGLKEWPHEKWIVPKKHEELTKSYEGWGERAQGLIKLLDQPTLSAWGVFDSPPVPFFHKGRVAMMGDAAHASGPFQAQGAGQAIEDACVLSALFKNITTRDDVPRALAAYDHVRRPRAQRAVSTSREAAQLMSMKRPGVGSDIEKMGKEFETRMHWIWHHDLVAQNEAAVKCFEETP